MIQQKKNEESLAKIEKEEPRVQVSKLREWFNKKKLIPPREKLKIKQNVSREQAMELKYNSIRTEIQES